jgi:putative transcriptional regulator
MENKKTKIQDLVIQKIKTLRTERNISQSSLSIILNISSGQIGNIESPKFQHKYTLKQIYNFCNYINFPFEEIFLTEEDMRAPNKVEILIYKIIEYDG